MSDSKKKYEEMRKEEKIRSYERAYGVGDGKAPFEDNKLYPYTPGIYSQPEQLLTKKSEASPKPNKRGGALRFNKGKTRYELVSNIGLHELARVYTLGAHKYTKYRLKSDPNAPIITGLDIPFEKVGNYEIIEDASENWLKGQNWTGAMASVKRHLAAWDAGEDIDEELGTYHLANAAWGLFAILHFYKTFPQGDDRRHGYLLDFKIGLDIDEVLADWVGDWCDSEGLPNRPTNWYFDRELLDKFDKMRGEDKLDEFYLNLKPLIDSKDLPFEPYCYITSRPVDSKVTEEWLAKHGFPARPVHTVGVDKTKVDIALEQGLDIFVDDGFHNFKALNKAGVCCYLMDAPHNQRYNVGHKRIKELKDLV